MFPVDTERNINLSKHSIMNKTKQGYVAPLSDLLVIRFEQGLLTGSPYGDQGAAGKNFSSGGVYNFDDED